MMILTSERERTIAQYDRSGYPEDNDRETDYIDRMVDAIIDGETEDEQ